MSPNHHICVCICTYKRPEMLRQLLSKLEEQRTEGLFDYSIVIVDNDSAESARQTVESYMHQSKVSIGYYVEPKQNIAMARNMAIENAKGDFIAFIDDDELPVSDWLYKLYTACTRFEADGVLGPVKQLFDKSYPVWIAKANIYERPSHPTGTVMRATDTRTGNLLLKRAIFDDADNRFEPQFGRTGGEDVWFFVKVIDKGRVFVWCDEAPVYEALPLERWKASYHLKRIVRIGGLTGEEVRTKGLPGRSILQVTAATCVYLLILPITIFFGKHVFMKFLIKSAYNIAYLLGYCGYVSIRFRDD